MKRLVIAAALLTGLVFAQPEQQEVIREQFDVDPGGTLEVRSDMGSIEVETTSDNRVEVTVERRPRGDSREDEARMMEDLPVEITRDGNTVRVEVRRRGNWGRGWGHDRNMRVWIRATVPSKFNVDLNTAGGSISVEDLEGSVEAETAGGSLSFGDIKGPVNGRTAGGSITLDGGEGTARLRTAGGSINIGRVKGDVDARTSGGSISIDRAEGTVDAHTSGGSINVDEVMGRIDASTSGGSVTASISAQPSDDCRLETSGGNVTVYLDPDLKMDLDAQAGGWGRVESDLPVTTRGTIKKSELRGEINGGGPLLRLRTSSGRIEIRKR